MVFYDVIARNVKRLKPQTDEYSNEAIWLTLCTSSTRLLRRGHWSKDAVSQLLE